MKQQILVFFILIMTIYMPPGWKNNVKLSLCMGKNKSVFKNLPSSERKTNDSAFLLRINMKFYHEIHEIHRKTSILQKKTTNFFFKEKCVTGCFINYIQSA